MCRYRSSIAVRVDDSTVRLLFVDGNDSHEEIRRQHHISDGGGLLDRYQTPLEWSPAHDLLDLDSYRLTFDAGKPNWWTEAHTESALGQYRAEATPRLESLRWEWRGSLDLSGLTSLPESASLTAGGYLDLSGLTSLPDGASLGAGGSLHLSALTSLPDGASLSAGGSLHLSSLTSLPESASLTAGGDLDLRGLTSLPEGASLTAGGFLDLHGLTSLPDGANVDIKGKIYLKKE